MKRVQFQGSGAWKPRPTSVLDRVVWDMRGLGITKYVGMFAYSDIRALLSLARAAVRWNSTRRSEPYEIDRMAAHEAGLVRAVERVARKTT